MIPLQAPLRRALLAPLFVVCLVACPGPAPGQNPPLPRAHAHNDYEHVRPLLDALDQGFCSVEADVWLVDGRLLVAHDLKDVKPDRTLEALYLDPLQERARRNNGRIHPGGPSLTLLIDVKSEATNAYRVLREVLRRYEPMLTRFTAKRTFTNAVTAILSGNRAREWMQSESERLAGYDGRLADLDAAPSPHFMPLISDNWRLHFSWKGTAADGGLPTGEREKLRRLVGRTHALGSRIRFWGLPDSAVVWDELDQAGVDLINTDDLPGLAAFLRRRPGQ